MNSTSLVPLLREPNAPPPRTVVHSGLANFRVVILNANTTAYLKLVCCKGSCPGATAADRAAQLARNAPDEVHLFNMAGREWEASGRFEQPGTDLAPSAEPALMTRLAALLPARDSRPSFNWPGCDLSGWPGGPPAPPPPPPPAPLTPHSNLTGRWKMLHGGGPTAIVQAASGELRMPVFKPGGVGKVDGTSGWFVFGNAGAQNLTLEVDAHFNTIHWSNKGIWRRVAYKSDDGSGPSQPSVAAFNPSFSAPSANGPSQNMPVGNGELVANVWVDGVRNGSLALLLGRSDVFSGNVQPLKLGRLRLSLDPNPFEGCFTRAGQAATPPFSQTLDLQRGLLNISAGDVRITVWSDINGADSVHVQIAAGTPTTVTVAIDSWQVPTQARWSLPHAPALAC